MKTINQRHKGIYSYKIDPKFRVSIPTSWRPEGGCVYLLESEEHGVPLVKVLSEEAYEERVERVMQSDMSAGDKSYYLEALAMMCREASINEQGKLLVPKELSERVGLVADSAVVLVGCGGYFQIIKPENHEVILENVRKRVMNDNLRIF